MLQKIEGIMSKEEFTNMVMEKIARHNEVFTLATINIDNFKTVNSYYGEYIGDYVLKKVAFVLKQNLKRDDLVCRSNNDEFYILLTNVLSENGFIIMEEIRKYFDLNTLHVGDKDRQKELNVKISVGIANYPRNAKSVEELFSGADSALLKAKIDGKNRVYLTESESMVIKSSYYTKSQIERLAKLSKKNEKTEAFLLREALDDLLEKYAGKSS